VQGQTLPLHAAASLCPKLLERTPRLGSGTQAQCLAALAAGLINANIAMAV
jgi:tetrahydromethanopterin S-methyltransferase subunit F